MKKVVFSILIAIYEAEWDALKMTLDSIASQSFRDYEIIVADDGSVNNNKVELEAYFADKDISHKLVFNKKNQGTLKNELSALSLAVGKYIKSLGQGDLLFDKDTLKRWVGFIKRNNYPDYFISLIQGFEIKEGVKKDKYFEHPFDLLAYMNYDTNKIVRNLIYYSDNVSGVAMICKKDFYERYLCDIKGVVTYEEDIFQVKAALDGSYPLIYKDYGVWYENSSGISTNVFSGYRKKLIEDTNNFYNYLYELYPDNIWLKKRKKISWIYVIENIYIRTLLRMVFDPGCIMYLLDHYLQNVGRKKAEKNRRKGFLDD